MKRKLFLTIGLMISLNAFAEDAPEGMFQETWDYLKSNKCHEAVQQLGQSVVSSGRRGVENTNAVATAIVKGGKCFWKELQTALQKLKRQRAKEALNKGKCLGKIEPGAFIPTSMPAGGTQDSIGTVVDMSNSQGGCGSQPTPVEQVAENAGLTTEPTETDDASGSSEEKDTELKEGNSQPAAPSE